jgi:hypothetical protein
VPAMSYHGPPRARIHRSCQPIAGLLTAHWKEQVGHLKRIVLGLKINQLAQTSLSSLRRNYSLLALLPLPLLQASCPPTFSSALADGSHSATPLDPIIARGCVNLGDGAP